jgi:hypothetical protein
MLKKHAYPCERYPPWDKGESIDKMYTTILEITTTNKG